VRRVRLQIPRNPAAEGSDANGDTTFGKDSCQKRVRTTRLREAPLVTIPVAYFFEVFQSFQRFAVSAGHVTVPNAASHTNRAPGLQPVLKALIRS
jgi:hypothetical protein